MKKNKAVLIDLDGVLRSDQDLLPGVAPFLEYLSVQKIPACILSNSTKFGGAGIVDFFQSKGLELTVPVLTAVDVTAEYLRQHHKTASIYCVPSAKKHLSLLPDAPVPEVVVIGDMADGWTQPLLNEIFNKVMKGSQMIAMQKNKYGIARGKHYLDAGSYIAALEYATGTKAKLIGKPSKEYFDIALQKTGASEFIMLGDDLTVDIEAAQKIGGKAALLLTGKTSRQMLEQQNIRPDYVFENLSDLLKSNIL